MDDKEQSLDYLKIGYYVVGGIIALFSLFPLMHVVIGIAAVTGNLGADSPDESFPPMFGWMFIIMGSVFIIVGEAIAIITLLCGRFIQRRKNYLFVFVVGCILCAFFPFGTAVGVFTIILFIKPEVKELFEKQPSNSAVDQGGGE